MKKLIQVMIFASMGVLLQAQTHKALFLGNSYTAVNNLPDIVANIATSMGDTLIWERNTPGGYTLEGHSTNSTSLSMIAEGNWDYVVLQEQSQRPAFPLPQVMIEVFPYARFLDSVINIHNPCAETMFYMTWGRKNGDAANCPNWPPVCTYQGMDSLLHLRYMMMADSNDAVVSAVGAVWRYIRYYYPGIELYSSDESHPSEAGSYAAACCFYTAMFRDDPLLISYDYTLSPTDAEDIKTAVRYVMYDTLMHWHIGEYDLSSDFDFAVISGQTYQFTNLSQNATGQLWDFDPGTSHISNPVHTFTGPGTYAVNLYSFDHCDTIISTKNIIILPTLINESEAFKDTFIYPNPAHSTIFLDPKPAKEYSFHIYSSTGSIMLNRENIRSNEIDINSLHTGLYYLKIIIGDEVVVRKFLKQ